MPKVALVTGGSRGIGQAIATLLAQKHDVAITWLTTPPAGVAEKVLALQADLTEQHAPQMVIDSILDRFGRIDLIVNNAGAVVESGLQSFDGDALAHMLHVNILAAQALLVAALPHLRAGSAIVSISSMNAELPPRGAALFGASKAALNLWTRGMAKELGPRGIRVNAVAPGAVHIADEPRSEELQKLFVDQTALGRLATPDDVAKAVRFLASPDAASITGEILTVSGGYRL